MIIVPELQKVFVLVPRTGSGTLYREMRRVYPKAMLLYRHMEADGCPQGYDRWERHGFVRHPLARLYSLYQFMRGFGGGAQVQGGAASADAARIHRQVARPFDDWLVNNRDAWTVPHDLNGNGVWWPVLSRRDCTPENIRSQWTYLRPDLGTIVHPFETLRDCMMQWGLDPTHVSNATKAHAEAAFSRDAWAHAERYQAWDLEQYSDR